MHIHDTLQSEQRDAEIAMPEEVVQTAFREFGIVRFDV